MIDSTGKTFALCVIGAGGEIEKRIGVKARFSEGASTAFESDFGVSLDTFVFETLAHCIIMEQVESLREFLDMPSDQPLPEDVTEQRFELVQKLIKLM